MSTSPSRECCVGRQCDQWSVGPRGNVKSTLLCSPLATSQPITPWSAEIQSFDSPVISPVISTKKIVPPVRLVGDTVTSAKKILGPVLLLRDPVKKKIVKVIVPPMRKSDGQHYVDPTKFNPTYLSEHMALSIPIAKCSAQHTVCSPISPYSMEMPSYDHNDDCMDCATEADGKLQEAEKEDTLILENEDVLNTTVSSACNYVNPKKKRGERLTKDAVSGSSAVIFALKHKVQSLQ